MSLLVANYGSSSEDDDSDNESSPASSAAKTIAQSSVSTSSAPIDLVPVAKDDSSTQSSESANAKNSNRDSTANRDTGSISDSDDSFSGHISDEEDEAKIRNHAPVKTQPSVAKASSDVDIIGLSGVGLSLPKPRNSSSETASSSKNDPLSSSSSSSFGLTLPTPKTDAESPVEAPDEELEDFVKPRDWEMQEAERNRSMKTSSSERANVSSSKSKSGKVKISIPSLRDLDDEDEEEVPDAGLKNDSGTKSKTGSGLFGLLPKPKNISETKMEKRPLIPHVLTKKPTSNSTTSAAKAQPLKRPAEVATEQQESNFFSLGDDEKLPQANFSSSSSSATSALSKRLQVSHPDPEEYPLSFKSMSKSPSPASSQSTSAPTTASAPMSYAQMYNMAAVDSQSSSHFVSEEETEKMNLAKLAGSQKVRGRELEDMDIVDVNADSALGGTSEIQENLLRELSAAGESGYRPQPKKGEGPSAVSKRKHQITYLAFQAKEREQLLKNQWSANAQTKRQTQAKYGF